MTADRSSRLAATWSGMVLVAACLTLLGPASPAQAAGCQSEVPTPVPPSACDDTTPPETALSPMSPQPNGANWTRSNDVSFTFAGTANDASDTDEVGLECMLEGPSQAHDWQPCTSPRTYTDLVDTPAGATYTFSVRAFDSADRSIAFDDPATPAPPFGQPDADTPDLDATPATVSWKQDTDPPSAAIFKGPYDADGSGWPIVDAPRVSYLVDSDEDDVEYRCQLDGTTVECRGGDNTFKGLQGGDHVFTATVKDAAGNEDETPAAKQFVVPYNLTRGNHWSREIAKGHFAGDYLQTKRFGAELKFRARLATDILLLAPAGPALGKIQVRVGDYRWRTINLASPDATTQRRFVIRHETSLFSGPVRIRSISQDKVVRVDGLIFPHR